MKRIFLANAFSLQMIDTEKITDIKITPLTIEETKNILKTGGFVSAIGHEDTAVVVSSILDTEVKQNRINVQLEKETTLIVAQLVGGRLPEGATILPEGFKMKFIKVELY